MRRWTEAAVFSALALAIHVVLFGLQSNDGVEAGGVGGEAIVSIEAASPAVIEMVEKWERPAARTPEPIETLIAPEPIKTPQTPRIQLSEAPRADLKVAALPALESDELNLDVQQPPPKPVKRPSEVEKSPTQEPKPVSEPPELEPSDIAPTSSPRPTERPQQRAEKQKEQQVEEKRKAEKASAGRAAQKAAGTGGSAQAGNSGAAQTTTVSRGQQAKLQAIWGSKIRSRIERAKRYPRGERDSGKVSLRISIGGNGRLLGVNVVQSSGNPTLDQAALAAVQRAGKFPPAPKGLAGNSFTFSLSVTLQRK